MCHVISDYWFPSWSFACWSIDDLPFNPRTSLITFNVHCFVAPVNKGRNSKTWRRFWSIWCCCIMLWRLNHIKAYDSVHAAWPLLLDSKLLATSMVQPTSSRGTALTRTLLTCWQKSALTFNTTSGDLKSFYMRRPAVHYSISNEPVSPLSHHEKAFSYRDSCCSDAFWWIMLSYCRAQDMCTRKQTHPQRLSENHSGLQKGTAMSNCLFGLRLTFATFWTDTCIRCVWLQKLSSRSPALASPTAKKNKWAD